MKRLVLSVAVVAATLVTGTVSASQNQNVELSPMVLVELQASMKADMLYAERMVRLDLRDDLQARSIELSREDIQAPVIFVLERALAQEQIWSVTAGE
jgi:hypothetical protein